jgi:hypothetical protein
MVARTAKRLVARTVKRLPQVLSTAATAARALSPWCLDKSAKQRMYRERIMTVPISGCILIAGGEHLILVLCVQGCNEFPHIFADDTTSY